MKPYPEFICFVCGISYGSKTIGYATWHDGTCGICGKRKAVTEPRDFGHLQDGWQDHNQGDKP